MQRDFDRHMRPAGGQYTTYQTTYTTSRSRPGDNTRQTMPPVQSVRGTYQAGPYSQNYPLPPPQAPSRPVRFAQAGTVTPSQSISQVDRQPVRDNRHGRTSVASVNMPRGSSNLIRVPDYQFLDLRDVPAYGQGPNTSNRPSYPQMRPVGPEAPAVVNNYNITNIRQTYNIDNSRHERVNARGQRNTRNFLYMTTSNTRRDTIDDSRTQQQIQGSSGRLQHRRGHRHHHNREHRG